MTKILVSSGCSFSDCFDSSNTWPNHLAKYFDNHYGLGRGGYGNGYISRSIIYAITNLLKIVDAKDIHVGIMWSSTERIDLRIPEYSNTGRIQTLIDQYTACRGEDWPDEIDTWENLSSNIQTEIADNWGNLRHRLEIYDKNLWIKDSVLDTKDWIQLTTSMKKHPELREPFVNFYSNKINNQVYSLEHILRTQWFLTNNNIKYFMSCYTDKVLDIPNNIDTSYLLDNIDLDKFVTTQGEEEWVRENIGHPIGFMSPTDYHPTSDSHKQWVEKVVIPIIGTKWKI